MSIVSAATVVSKTYRFGGVKNSHIQRWFTMLIEEHITVHNVNRLKHGCTMVPSQTESPEEIPLLLRKAIEAGIKIMKYPEMVKAFKTLPHQTKKLDATLLYRFVKDHVPNCSRDRKELIKTIIKTIYFVTIANEQDWLGLVRNDASLDDPQEIMNTIRRGVQLCGEQMTIENDTVGAVLDSCSSHQAMRLVLIPSLIALVCDSISNETIRVGISALDEAEEDNDEEIVKMFEDLYVHHQRPHNVKAKVSLPNSRIPLLYPEETLPSRVVIVPEHGVVKTETMRTREMMDGLISSLQELPTTMASAHA